MATVHRNKIKKLYINFKVGTPLTSEDLAGLGVSADLAAYYVREGWLQRLARGVYCRPNDPPALHPSLTLLQRHHKSLHVGGTTALDWNGMGHYLRHRPVTFLYGWAAVQLPAWFTDRFPAHYWRKRLFEEDADAPLHVRQFHGQKDGPMVSKPERALLEMLSHVGIGQPLADAREVMHFTQGLRPQVMSELLKRCRSVKTVRLCLMLGRECAFPLPWAKKLDAAKLPTGSGSRWVSRSVDGLLVLDPAKSFKDLVQRRATDDPVFAEALARKGSDIISDD